jgi:hypothetical protein
MGNRLDGRWRITTAVELPNRAQRREHWVHLLIDKFDKLWMAAGFTGSVGNSGLLKHQLFAKLQL